MAKNEFEYKEFQLETTAQRNKNDKAKLNWLNSLGKKGWMLCQEIYYSHNEDGDEWYSSLFFRSK